ncbi:MAG: DMT family transporter [Candidatus Thermoplasmatota archaeon]|nr:DMT family transporter [Candidatus Thermoplasmatota archaeon]
MTPLSVEKKSFYVIILLPIIFWAFAFPFIKIGLQELSPVNLTILRLFLVCGVFLFLMVIMPRKFTPLKKKDLLPLFFLGFFGVVVYHLGLNYGELYISASAASLIIASIPVFTVIFAALLLKEKLTTKIVSGVVLSLGGVMIISLTGTSSNPFEITYLSAAVAVFISALAGAGYTIAGKKLLTRYSALSLTVYAFLFGSLGLLPFVSSSLVEEIIELSLNGWGAVLFLALFPTVVGYILWYVALEIKTASEISVFLYFIPVLSTVISFFLFQEPITVLFLLGGVLVIGGLIVVHIQKTSSVQKS